MQDFERDDPEAGSGQERRVGQRQRGVEWCGLMNTPETTSASNRGGPDLRVWPTRWWLVLIVLAGCTVLFPHLGLPHFFPADWKVLAAVWWQGDSEQNTPDSEPPFEEGDPVERRAEMFHLLGTPGWHSAGHRGRGVKVAILDSGFCGYRAHLGKALPARVTVHSFRHDGNLEARNSQHGVLCGEVVHALAPEAELLLANWETDRPEQFLEAVRWARNQGRGSSPAR